MPLNKLTLGNVDSTLLKADLHIPIAAPADGVYVIALKTSIGGTINTINVQTTSGTCNVAVRINGVNVVWPSAATTVAASSTINEKAAASSNTFGTGAKLELVISGSSSPVNLSTSIAYTRTA